MFGFNPNFKRYWEFGCTCYHWRKPSSNKEKFTGTGRLAFYLGWSVTHNAHLVYDLETGLEPSHAVKCREGNYDAVKLFKKKYHADIGESDDGLDWTPKAGGPDVQEASQPGGIGAGPSHRLEGQP